MVVVLREKEVFSLSTRENGWRVKLLQLRWIEHVQPRHGFPSFLFLQKIFPFHGNLQEVYAR